MFNKSTNTIEREFKNLRNELLDLTLRNQLLNFKSRAKTITIVNQSTVNLFQTLVLQQNKMYFVANKKDNSKDKSSVWDHIPFDFSKFTEGDKKLATDLTPKELQKRLYYINNQAKTMLQEQGYNILYLAIGFLEWKDKSKPKQKNKAPLVLIPVSMERKKVGESFNLEWTGEDIQTNISLKAKLVDAGIELPDFEFKKYGEVIDHYLSSVQNEVNKRTSWKVTDEVALGFFSFTKFVMYNDLNPDAWADNVDLTKNELIQAIFNPAKNDQESFKEEDIDSQLEYKNMYQVLDADSSQIAAIEDVKEGRNLVVEGPPGTGKSQTIVNLIAELLAEGKSVLFVSEKMAALDVVKDRLTNVGLGKFVLELHSHKTRRKKFLKDLQKATNVRSQGDFNVDHTIRKLETLKKQLDDYCQVIHKPEFAVNLSAYELYGMKESADDYFSKKNTIMPLVRFKNPENITLKELYDLKISLENLAELYQTISNENPWSNCSPKSLFPADLREIEMLINDTLISLDNFLVERSRVYEIYGIKKPDTLNEFQNSLSAFEIFKSKNAQLIDEGILKSEIWVSNANESFKLIADLENYQQQAEFLSKFNQNILNVNIDKLIYDLRSISTKKFRFFNNKQHIELVERYYAKPVSGSVEDIIDDLNYAKEVINFKHKLEELNYYGEEYFGKYWHLNANINDLKAIANWMREFTNLVHEGTFSKDTIDLMSKNLFDINPERDLAEYIDSGEEFVKSLSNLKDNLNPNSKLIFKRETGDVSFEAWKNQLYAWKGQISSLHLWSQYLNTKNSLKNSNAKMFVESIEKRNIQKDDIPALVDGNFADSLLNILFVENQELASFVGELHENRIREFKDLDEQILILNRKRIYNKLNSNIPKIFGGTDNPQAKILAGEFTRKSGHMPVRKLLEKTGGLIKQIKPCFMMSPLSIAQYLDPTNEELQFDVVIFDEASQVKPEDALGAFMRGKTAVVMGDTQQLPPTSFFDQMSDGFSDEEEATSLDMESILHLCKLSFPVKMLKWHYRSRHESLIAVSNREFYDNDLLVYPSPSYTDPELGLKFHYNPNTSYDRGSSSANILEAGDVVDEIFNHFEKYGDTKSLGVGTFSVAQKNAILEALEIKRKQHPEYEPLFSDTKDERFFVKNLETIQGDERDVILISVGYGFDKDKKMSLNFGPLNQDGGERRLNVLITRAREKCVVFSNFKAYDMHLTANPPYGVKALKEFLKYAENLTLGTSEPQNHVKEPFEDAIVSFLEENGYTVDRQIGCAGFRVDLAIVDDENPGKYILGITTDGKMYSSSKVARDRDRLREQVLTGLGWRLYHLWSTDWYRNRDLGRKKLLDFVEKSIVEIHEEEKRKSEEEKKLAEKRRLEAKKKAEELRLAHEREEAQKEKDEIPDNISSEDFVEVIDDEDDILEKPIDVSTLNPDELFDSEEIQLNESESDSENDLNDNITESKINSESDLDDENISVVENPLGGDEDSLEDDVSEVDVDSSIDENDNIDLNSDEDKQDYNNIDDLNTNKSDNDTHEEVNDNSSVSDKIKSFISFNKTKSNKKDSNSDSLKFKKELGENSSLEKDNNDENSQSNEFHSVDDNVDSSVETNESSRLNEDEFEIDSSVGEVKDNQKDDSQLIRVSDLDDNVDSFDETNESSRLNEDDVEIDSSVGEVSDNQKDGSQFDDNNSEDNEIDISQSDVNVNKSEKTNIHNSIDKSNFIKSFISDVVSRQTRLEPDDVKKVSGKIINEDNPVYEPSYREDRVVEVDAKEPKDISDIVNDAKKHFIDELFDNIDLVNENQNETINNNEEDIQYNKSTKIGQDKNYDASIGDGINYYQGSNDVNSKLRKNNLYYEDNKPKSVKDSIQGIKKDIKYINNSLKEIENPTEIDYVSVVDRTKEYNPDDYLNHESDDDSYIFVKKEEELTFAEKEEIRIKKELEMDDFKKEIASDENVIIPIHEEQRRKDLEDKALDDIIQTADIDYREIEKERHMKNNKLKSFDNHRLPDKNKLKDEIVDYVEITDIGLNSSEELYNKPVDEVADSVKVIVDGEGPIHIDELTKRIKLCCNIKRASVNLKKTVNSAIKFAEDKGNIIKDGDFLYNASNNDITVRKRDKPNIDLISYEEISKSIELVLLHKSDVKIKQVPKETSRNFGFKSTSKKTASRINNVLDLMIAENKVKIEKDIVELV